MKPIRILHVVTYMGRGGLETMLMNYYRHINREQVQFDFLVHRHFEADYDQEILSLGGKIYHLPPLNPFSISYHKAIDKFFDEHNEYKIIHVHQDCLSSILLKHAYKHHIPVRIAHAHSSSQDKNIKYILKKYYMRTIPKYATQLFACGKEAGDWMFSGAQYDVINNAIDTSLFIYNEKIRKKIRKELDIDDSTFVIGHVGRFNYPKNHDYLIDIFYQIYQLNNDSKLMLVGSGDLMEQIKEKVHQLGLDKHVMFLGSRSDVNQLMQVMDIFVFPSHYEGLPVTMVEAQASGLVVLKSDNVPNESAVTENVYSLSLDEDAKTWAKKIIELSSISRNNTFLDIEKAGYDIKKNAMWLQEFYQREVMKHE